MIKKILITVKIMCISIYSFSQNLSEIIVELRLNNDICNTANNKNIDFHFQIKNKSNNSELIFEKKSSHLCSDDSINLSYSSLDPLNNYFQKGYNSENLIFEANLSSSNKLIAFQNDNFFLPMNNDSINILSKSSRNSQDSIFPEVPIFLKDLNDSLNFKANSNQKSEINNFLTKGVSNSSSQFAIENSNDSIIIYYILIETFKINNN
jgi:hypothetical protein